MPKAHVRVPTDIQEAAELLAETRYSRHNKVTKAEIFRTALREYIARQDDLPGEAADLLDVDLIANAGGDTDEVDA